MTFSAERGRKAKQTSGVTMGVLGFYFHLVLLLFQQQHHHYHRYHHQHHLAVIQRIL